MSRITQLEEDIKKGIYPQEVYQRQITDIRTHMLSINNTEIGLLQHAVDAAEVVIETLFTRYKK